MCKRLANLEVSRTYDAEVLATNGAMESTMCAKSATGEGAAWVPTTSSPVRSGRWWEHSRSNVLNVELRPGSPVANRRGKPSTTHTRPAESLRTLKPWPKPWQPPTRTVRSTHISSGREHSSACISIHHHKMVRPPPRGVKGLRSHPRASQKWIYTRS